MGVASICRRADGEMAGGYQNVLNKGLPLHFHAQPSLAGHSFLFVLRIDGINVSNTLCKRNRIIVAQTALDKKGRFYFVD